MQVSYIDTEQPESVEEHFDLILANEDLVDSTYSNVTSHDLPSWFDEELFKKGQNFYKNNIFAASTAGLSGLMAIFLIPSIKNVLVFTKNSSTPCLAFKRYFQTSLHESNFYLHDPKDSESKFYKSINTIRWKHSNTSKRYGKKKEDEGILQKDMVLTQFATIGYILACPKKLGISEISEGKEGFVHLWRVVGHLLGIPERINLCRRNYNETTLLCEKILNEVFGKLLDDASNDFYDLIDIPMNGLKCLDPLIDVDAFLVFFYDLHNKKYEQKISRISKLKADYRKLNFYLIRTPYIGYFVRHYWNFFLRTVTWLNEKYPVIAWIRFGKSNSKINMFPSLVR